MDARAKKYTVVSTNILDAIGDTHLIEIDGMFAECLVEHAEATGQLKPGDTIVEAPGAEKPLSFH